MVFVCNTLFLNMNIFISMDFQIFSAKSIWIALHNHGAG
ncbi:hypothetical protein ADINL_2893 [Nitrincola lacisaponensis]|uniref:Uncharacterized protein n=1 Tax=Nitrincola lacisaponensis TaxID=267850 RepID=A0A063XW53_9GAMM|nr:hypothetical protein ADINL_2893 [Nitrincola lacisaponensis]